MDATFKLDDTLLETIREMRDRLDDLVVPMTAISKLFVEEMKQNITSRKVNSNGSTWAPLKESTLKRHDAVLGVESNKTLGGAQPFVRDNVAGAFTAGRGGVFMERGRGRDWRRGFNSAKPAKKSGRRRALSEQARDAFGERISGTEMEAREFGYVTEPTQDRAEKILLDYLFTKV